MSRVYLEMSSIEYGFGVNETTSPYRLHSAHVTTAREALEVAVVFLESFRKPGSAAQSREFGTWECDREHQS